MEVHVNAEGHDGILVALLARAVRTAVETHGGEPPAEISLTLLDDDAIRQLNAEYLGRDRPTDVIAFALGQEDVLGDVYVGRDRALAQAEENGVTVEEELVRLAVHGTLHVLGLDHPEGPERLASPMFDLQERVVRAVMPTG